MPAAVRATGSIGSITARAGSGDSLPLTCFSALRVT
jgi:hypothetical protein